jgi:hypothetical protein
MDSKDLGKAFEDSIVGNEIEGITEESLDSVVDILTNNELLEEIPIVKYIFSGYKIYNGIREKAEIKKLLIFLYQLTSLKDKDRKSLIDKIEENPKFKKKTFERVVLIVERLDEVEKAKITGKLFLNYILKNIDQDTFFRLCFAVERTFLTSLKALEESYRANYKERPQGVTFAAVIRDPLMNKELSYVGLMKETLESTNRGDRGVQTKTTYNYRYDISELGMTLAKYGF